MLRTRLIAGPVAGLVLSAAFATVLVGVAASETLLAPLRVDPTRPAPVTLRLPPVTIRETGARGAVTLRTIHPLVARGEVAPDARVATLARVFEQGRRPPRIGALLGLWAFYFLLAFALTSYLRTFVPSRGALLRTQAGLLGLAAILLACAKVFLLITPLPVTLIPVGALPLWAALHLDRRTSFIVSTTLAFLTASFVGFSLTAVTVFMASGVAAVFAFRDRKHSRALVPAGLAAGLVASLVLVAAKMLFEGGLDVAGDLRKLSHSELLATFVGGSLSGAVAFLLEPIAVTVLGVATRARLLDLTDLEQPLLQKMAREAPGSWEHSRAMANLAEAAAASIGADALLTRVGAYYHDLGKTCQPRYFIENLLHGETSPHVELEPDVSADAIMAHVVEGVRILRDGGIPESVVEFAYTHHGTSVIEYFWHKCLERGNPKNLTEAFFRYPGMRPRNKETAILMLIDSIEAGARTIQPPERAKFEELVQRIVFVKLRQGQLDESGLTLEDLRVLSTRIVDTLVSVHHHRVRYPWQERQASGGAQLPVPGVATEADVARERSAAGLDGPAAQEPDGGADETRSDDAPGC
jgi:putative nucleotidyltransferase with HDIG domain